MSDLKTPLGEITDRREVLMSQITVLMARGAAYGAALFFGLIIVVLLIRMVGGWLPDESREMPDPNILQRGSLELVTATEVV